MGIYKIETRGSGFTGQTLHNDGDKFAAQVYTEDLPSGEPIEDFTSDFAKPIGGKIDRGYIIRCALLIKNDGLHLINTKKDPADVLENASKPAGGGFAFASLPQLALADLNTSPKIIIPRDYLELRGGIRLLAPYRRLDQIYREIKTCLVQGAGSRIISPRYIYVY